MYPYNSILSKMIVDRHTGENKFFIFLTQHQRKILRCQHHLSVASLAS